MSEVPASSPHLPVLPLVGTAASASAYALWLSTEPGRKWATHRTWATVGAGVVLTLGWLAAWRKGAVVWAALFFVATGAPLVLRSLVLELKQLERLFDHSIGQ